MSFNLLRSAKMVPRLSRRRTQVLLALAEGRPHKEIADILGVSHKTVEHHVTMTYKAIGVHCIAHATRAAVKAGLIDTI